MVSASSKLSPSDDEAKSFLNKGNSRSRERSLDIENQDIGPLNNRGKSTSLKFVAWALTNILSTICIVSLLRKPFRLLDAQEH